MKQFITYLDKCSTRNYRTHKDYIELLHAINYDYCNQFTMPVAPTSSYIEWQNNHEVDLAFPQATETVKEKKQILAKIESIDDILKIVDENPYDEQYEYNIDLKRLTNIYDELGELNKMVGLHDLKKSVVNQLLYFIQDLHIGKNGDFKHTVLYGPPGTGKTEIAKLIGKIYSKIGVLKNNAFQKVTRGDLIAGYLGQTAIKTQKVIEKSLGGVLFIDEAYSLGDFSQNDSFSKECIDTLCEALSNYKENLMVIIAGYEEELNERLFSSNKGLESRFIWRFRMEPYTTGELYEIFTKMVKQNDWKTDIVDESWFSNKESCFPFYGRDMEQLFTYVKISHGRRVYGLPQDKRKCITKEDLDSGYETFERNKTNQKKKSDLEKILYSMYT